APAHLVDRELEAITSPSEELDRHRVERRGRGARGAAPLHRRPLLNRLAARIHRESVAGGGRPDQDRDFRRARDVLVLPAGQGIQAELVRRHRGGPREGRHLGPLRCVVDRGCSARAGAALLALRVVLVLPRVVREPTVRAVPPLRLSGHQTNLSKSWSASKSSFPSRSRLATSRATSWLEKYRR